MRSIALILALIISTQAVAEDAGYTGRWGQDGQCDNGPRAEDPSTVMTIRQDGYEGYEYACKFISVTPSGVPNAWQVEANCVGEGQTYRDSVSWDMTSNGLALMVIRRGQEIPVYNRCDETP